MWKIVSEFFTSHGSRVHGGWVIFQSLSFCYCLKASLDKYMNFKMRFDGGKSLLYILIRFCELNSHFKFINCLFKILLLSG